MMATTTTDAAVTAARQRLPAARRPRPLPRRRPRPHRYRDDDDRGAARPAARRVRRPRGDPRRRRGPPRGRHAAGRPTPGLVGMMPGMAAAAAGMMPAGMGMMPGMIPGGMGMPPNIMRPNLPMGAPREAATCRPRSTRRSSAAVRATCRRHGHRAHAQRALHADDHRV